MPGGGEGALEVEEGFDHEADDGVENFFAVAKGESVFGVGTAYPSSQLVVMVVFCRDGFSREAAENFLPLASLFKGATGSLVEKGAIFSD